MEKKRKRDAKGHILRPLLVDDEGKNGALRQLSYQRLYTLTYLLHFSIKMLNLARKEDKSASLLAGSSKKQIK